MSVFTNNYSYHQSVKRFIIAFGNLFAGIGIEKHEKDGSVRGTRTVPIAACPRNKWVSRQFEQPDLMAPQVEISLPRITFEMVEIKYAPERKIGFQGAYVLGNQDGKRTKIFNPAPWDAMFNLYTYTKDQTDSLQIMEQILPFFQPSLTLNYEVLPEFQVKKDVPITLMNVQSQDTYAGSPEEYRDVIQTFTFATKLDFFGPMPSSGSVIKKALIDFAYLFPNPPHSQYEAKVDPLTADKDDVYTIIETTRTLA